MKSINVYCTNATSFIEAYVLSFGKDFELKVLKIFMNELTDLISD